MLPYSRRLRAAEVRTVIATGRPLGRAAHLSGKFLAAPGPLRSAVVVSKKVAKQAVVRNRLRRAAYRALQGVPGHGSAVFFVTKLPAPPLQSAFAADLKALLAKLT
jgi:RNase P protein component